MKKHLRLACASAVALGFAVGQSALASGFEKSIMFGGETSGVAGIATSYMEGSQALFFNPAGLVSKKADAKDVSLNISPVMVNYNEQNVAGSQTSSNHVLLPFSLMYGQTISDSFGFGVGIYTSGGGYGDFSYSGADSKFDLAIYEASVGVAYKIMNGLKIGAAYRVSMVQANMNIFTGADQINLSSLKDTNYGGFKLGAQYQIADRWDLGLTFRSRVDFKAKGTISDNGTGLGDATVGTDLPSAWTLGTSFYVADTWRMFAEYAYTNYSSVTNLAINNSSLNESLGLNFKDQHNIRVAAEYKGWSWPVRFGYIWTSDVTDQGHMLPGLTPPGAANTLTLGSGQTFSMGGQAIRLDGGLEYTWMSGSSNGQPPYTNGSNTLSETAVHLGASYMF